MLTEFNVTPVQAPKLTRGLHILAGDNFSGRTDFLKSLAGVEPPNPILSKDAVYLGPEPETALSGLALSVAQELRLHGLGPTKEIPAHISHLLMLNPLYHRVPHTLSGGETAKLVFGCALLMSTELLCIDGTLEQIDHSTRRKVLEALEKLTDKVTCISDNRLSELGVAPNLNPPPASREAIALPVEPKSYPAARIRPARLELNSIEYRYKNDLPVVLQDASATFEAGQVYYLEGANGAGKSTLAKLLCGVMPPRRGAVTFDGKPHRPWEYGNKVISYSFQNPDRGRLRGTLRAELAASARYLDQMEDSSSERARQVAAALGLEKLYDEPIDLLPYAVRKRVALAAALLPEVPWLFLDEPTLGQADSAVSGLACMLAKEAASGRGIIIVSHTASLRSQLPGRRLLLVDGQLTVPPSS